ncbi:MAG: CAP domain-containing protein [Ardenticatenia bacterium]|nr:CAP domain-containing protein [Ardenticatenia bacterium]
MNATRAQAGLPPVTENPAWSDGAEKHARYTVKNDYVGHDEDPATPWFTPEGRGAGRSGNVLVSSDVNMRAEKAIDMWLQGPFHALGLLDPALRETGFGLYREEIGIRHFGATVDVLRGRTSVPPEVSFPVMWPGDGTAVRLTPYVGNEFPDPLSPCPGYQAPTGCPSWYSSAAAPGRPAWRPMRSGVGRWNWNPVFSTRPPTPTSHRKWNGGDEICWARVMP